MLDALAQHVGRFALTVHHIHLPGCAGHFVQPTQQLVGVGMGRGRLDLRYFGPDRHILSMDADGVAATGQGRPACTWGLITRQDDHVAVVARVLRQVVQDAPPSGHATGRQNHHGAVPVHQ